MAGTKISAMPAVGSSGATAWVDADVIPVVDTSATTNRKLTRAQLRAQIADSPTDLAVLRYSSGSADWLVTTPSAMITGLTAISTLAGADLLPINQSTTGKKVSITQLRAQLPLDAPADGDMIRYNSGTSTWEACTPAGLRYRTVATGRYTGLIGGTPSIITMSSTSDMGVGYPVRYVVSGTTYYGIITAMTASTSITVAGPALAAAATVSSLAVGTPEMVSVVQLFVANSYGNGVTSTLLATDMKTYFTWNRQKAYLVRYSVTHNTPAGTTQPTINVNVAGSAVGTENSNNGILPTTAGTWISTTLASINSSNYDINWGESLEVACTVAGNPVDDALDLTVLCVFVQE